MADGAAAGETSRRRRKFNYGWVVVAASTFMIAVTYGLVYSYSVAFIPLAESFKWDRATTSLLYSGSQFLRGAFAIGVGLLADKYGPRRLSVFCGFMIILGLVLASRAQTIGQFFLAYDVVEAIGLCGAFGMCTTVVSRWFVRNRGLALGIVSTGAGLGTLVVVPAMERLITAQGWPQAFVIAGVVGGAITIIAGLALRPPAPAVPPGDRAPESDGRAEKRAARQTDATLWRAMRDVRMVLLLGALLLFFFDMQIVMVHLVNFARDMGVEPLVAAALISLVGAVTIPGRLATGISADRIGTSNTLIATQALLVVSFICLIFAQSLAMFIVFAVVFGLTYGGEVPLIPLLVSRFCGMKAMTAVVGLTVFVTNIGGAIGPWVAGAIFDSTQSYHWAFVVGAVVAVFALVLAVLLKRRG